MDVDAYVTQHRSSWQRLETLCRQRRLSAAEVDEFIHLYQRAGTHLATVRSHGADPNVTSYLSMLVANARIKASAPARVTWNAPVTFFLETFPAMLYRTRRWWLITMALWWAVSALWTWWFIANPDILQSMMSNEEIKQLVEVQFENYYSEHAAASFGFLVWMNNAWVAAVCLAAGALGAPVVWMLLQNSVNVAVAAALMISHGRGSLFFGLILPHGLLELTAVFVAAGAGMRLFWAWIVPGDRPRRVAFAQEGRSTIGMALGLVVVLFITGVIEAFVTPSPLPTWARLSIGIAAELGFFAYVWTLGKAAHRRGAVTDTQHAGELLAPTA